MSILARWTWYGLSALVLLLLVTTLEAQRPTPGPDALPCPPNCPEPVYTVSVSPDGTTSPSHPINTGPFAASFTVMNTGNQPDTYTLSCSGTNGITCDPVSPSTLSLAPSASTTVQVWHRTGAIPGTGRITLNAAGEGADNGYFNVPMTSFVSLVPYNAVVRNMSQCVASCFNLVWSHNPPAYYSLGTPRAFGLTYSSSSARPTPVVTLDVTPAGTPGPTHYEVQIRRSSDNVLLTLVNGATSVFFTASTQVTRIAVPVDTRTNGSWMANPTVNVTVTAHYAAGSPISNTLATQLRFLDRTQSNAFGAGFWPAGIQRYYGTTSGPLVVESDGSQFLYAGYATPGGTSARLTTHGSTALRRTYLDGSFIEFDLNSGLPNKAADRFGNTTTYTWSGVQLQSIQDPVGKVTTLTYDGNGNLATVTDPAGRVTRYTINSTGRLVSIQDADNVITTLGYNTLGLLTSVTDRGGKVWDYAYDQLNRLRTATAPTIPLFSGGTGRPITTYTSGDAAVWQPAIVGTSLATAKAAIVGDTAQARIADPLGAVSKFKLDKVGNALRITDPLGQITTIDRDSMFRPTLMVHPNGHRTQLAWGTGSQPLLNNSPYLLDEYRDITTSRTVRHYYNSRNDVTAIFGNVAADMDRQDFTYHSGGARGPAGAVDTVKVGGRVVEIHTVDNKGRDSIVAHGDTSHKTKLFYDAAWGSLNRTINPRGNTTRQHLDAVGRADSLYTPDSRVWSTTYGLMNSVLTTRDPLGNLTRTEYNPDLTVKRMVDPKTQVYRFAFNALGSLTLQYDLADTLKSEQAAYDQGGRTRTITNRRGQAVSMTYDAAGRLLSRSGTGVVTDTYRYDPSGRWVVGTNVYSYDSLSFDQAGRLDREFQRIGAKTFEFRYQYDRQDRVTTRTLYVNGVSQSPGVLTRTYDAFGMLVSTTAGGVTASLRRETVEGLPARWVINAGAADSWYVAKVFNKEHQVERDSFNVAQLDQLFGRKVSYDVMDRISEVDAGSNVVATYQDQYRYDAAGRLVHACTVGTQGTCGSEYGFVGLTPDIYTYDAAGNRTDPLASPVVAAGNRTQQFRGNTLTYDLDGNTISKVGNGVTWGYTWDALGRLTEVKKAVASLSIFGYDAFGRRVKRTLPGATEWYVYDGDQVILDLDASLAIKREYGWYPGTDKLLSVSVPGAFAAVATRDERQGDAHWGLANKNGGALIKEYYSTPWGGLTADTGTVIRMHMAGREYDQETELYYMRARYYDPKLGRFISEDPIGIAGGLNLYAYALNNPISYADPTGLGGDCPDDEDCPPQYLPENGVSAPRPPPGYSGPLGYPVPPGPGRGNNADVGGGAPKGGGVGAFAVSPSNPRKCVAGVAIAVVSIASDVALVTGVRAVVRLGALAYGTGNAARMVAQGELRERAATEVAKANAYWGVGGQTAVRVGAEYGTSVGGEALISQGNGFNIGISNFIPIVGSVFAVGDAIDACSE